MTVVGDPAADDGPSAAKHAPYSSRLLRCLQPGNAVPLGRTGNAPQPADLCCLLLDLLLSSSELDHS